MKKPLLNYKAIKKRLFLSWYESKRLLGHPLRLLFLLLLFFALILVGKEFVAGDQSLPQVIIVDEDGSVEVRTFIENIAYNKLKNTVAFKESNLEEALIDLENNNAIGIIHIPPDTRKNLDTLSPAGMSLYIKDSKDIRVQLLIGYIGDMIDLLNEGQSGAMVYWKEMVKEGLSRDERLEEFENISFDYGVAFLTRGDVFSVNDIKDPLKGLLPIQYYGYGLIWAMLLISALVAHMGRIEDRKKGFKERLLLSGYSENDYFMSGLMSGTIFSFACLLVLLFLYKVILDIELLRLHIGLWSMCLWIVLLMNAFMLLAIDYLNNQKYLLPVGLIFSLLLYSSGLMIPEFYLSDTFKWLGTMNIINFGDNIFKGYPLSTWRSLLPVLYSGIAYILYKRLHSREVS